MGGGGVKGVYSVKKVGNILKSRGEERVNDML